MSEDTPTATDIVHLTSDIVAAFVSNNTVRAAELTELIATVHQALATIGSPKLEEPAADLKPAVPIKKSITDDYLICLDDGKRFKSLKRHLQQAFGMSPDEYRTKWGLARDYPMVAPGYAAKRSELAKASGLGADRRKAPAPPVAAPAAQPDMVEAPSKKRGRPKKEMAEAA